MGRNSYIYSYTGNLFFISIYPKQKGYNNIKVVILLLESLKTLLLSIAGFVAAGFLVAGVLSSFDWLFHSKRPLWVQLMTALALFSFLVLYPGILFIQGCTNHDPYAPYEEERPYDENIYDRYR